MELTTCSRDGYLIQKFSWMILFGEHAFKLVEKLTSSIKNWSEPQQPFKFDLVILWVINIITVICKYSSLQLYHVWLYLNIRVWDAFFEYHSAASKILKICNRFPTKLYSNVSLALSRDYLLHSHTDPPKSFEQSFKTCHRLIYMLLILLRYS